MIQSYEAVIDQHGELKIPNPVELPRGRRVIITILEDEVNGEVSHEELELVPAVSIHSPTDNAESLLQAQTSKDFLLSIAGTFESEIGDTSQNVKSFVQDALLKKYGT